MRLVVLETGENTSLDGAAFELRRHLQRATSTASQADAARSAMRDPAFYPAPAGYSWFEIDDAAHVNVTRFVSAEPLALARVDDGLSLALRDFRILGEEEADGARAMRLRPREARSGDFRRLLERARGSQVLFTAGHRVLLAVNVQAAVAGDFWLLDLPRRGESSFVDRLSRAAETPR